MTDMKSTECPVLCLGEALIDVIKRAGNVEEKVGAASLTWLAESPV